ncbi:MAG: hypothetical protein Kow00117_14580 [Phototrophicales bacterium]
MLKRIVLLLILVGVTRAVLGQSSTGVTAEAIGTANLRSRPDINADLVGSISNGTVYPVVGRSEFYPWVLLGDITSERPIGWVFQDLVIINGNLFNVPISSLDINELQQPTATTVALNTPSPANTSDPNTTPGQPTATLVGGVQVTPLGTAPPVTPLVVASPTPSYAVYGSVLGEINVRYGPGTDYQIVGRAFAGDIFPITRYHTQFPWVEVVYESSPNQRAWIAIDLLEIQGDIYSLPAESSTRFNLPTLTPTPALSLSSSIPGQPAVPLSPAFENLANQIWDFVLSRGFIPETSTFGALYIQNLQTGEAITFGNNFAFSGTSTNKIAVLLEFFARMDGSPNLSEAIDIANTMICSENVATNRLIGFAGDGDMLLGAERTTELLNALGMERTFLTAPYHTATGIATATPMPRQPLYPQTTANQSRTNPDPTNQMTVEEIGWMMSNIYQCAFNEGGPLIENFNGAITPQECRKILYVMSENTVDGMLRAGVPSYIRVSHKHGWIADTHSNAAVFYTPGADYVIVMALYEPEWLNFQRSLPVMAETSRMVYNFYNPTSPLEQVREGYIPEAAECNYTAESPVVQNLASPVFLLENDQSVFRPAFVPVPSSPATPTPTPGQ